MRGLCPGLCQVQRAQGLEGRLRSAHLSRDAAGMRISLTTESGTELGTIGEKKGSSAGNCFLSIPSNLITSQLESIYAFFVYET